MDVGRAAAIAALANNPAFQALVDEITEKQAVFRDKTTDVLLRTGKTYDNFEYERGYWAGLQQAARYPIIATNTLEADAKKRLKENHE